MWLLSDNNAIIIICKPFLVFTLATAGVLLIITVFSSMLLFLSFLTPVPFLRGTHLSYIYKSGLNYKCRSWH